MAEEITPYAEPIPTTGEAEWFPPAEDDADAPLHPRGEPSTLRSVFIGTQGLRAGWSILLYAVFAALLLFSLFGLLSATHVLHRPAKGETPPAQTLMIAEYGQFACFALAALCVSFVERRRFAQYGLGSIAPRVPQFFAGLFWGALLLAGLVGLLWSAHFLRFDGRLLGGPDALRWGLFWLAGFLGVGFFEEFLFRGFLQFTVARGLAGIGEALGWSLGTRKTLGFWVHRSALLFFLRPGAQEQRR